MKVLGAVVCIVGFWVASSGAKDLKTWENGSLLLSPATDSVQPVLCSAVNADKSMLLAQSSCPGGGHGCITSACGVMSGQIYCCPYGHRYLNHCDCLCYTGNNFDCNSYSYCNQ
ncbi:MAG: hypothetical protein A3I70_02115 [Deltaproteobacteria bacterium RIFCSPLOWO2_02_FULL_44_34]|nr:MAG: hypothetical protein A3I70_02115 [Deltaproteobacteria bacterium RIFCSPLOWO2_02_FULL_44_34]